MDTDRDIYKDRDMDTDRNMDTDRDIYKDRDMDTDRNIDKDRDIDKDIDEDRDTDRNIDKDRDIDKDREKQINKTVCIIGTGWYGCYIIEYLLKNYNNINIIVFEKNSDIMMESSIKNQNRLHLGFHYPRCNITLQKCKKYYYYFLEKYNNLIETIPNNYYIISKESNIKYTNYLKLYSQDDYNIQNQKNIFLNYDNIDGDIINTHEKYINFNKSCKYFKELFNKKITKYTKQNTLTFYFNTLITKITESNPGIVKIETETGIIYNFNKIINCTYNQLIDNSINQPIIYEKCISLIYDKINNNPKINIGSLTIMDGEFSSLYYYNTIRNNNSNNNSDNDKQQFTLTNVKLTPLIKSTDFNKVANFKLDNINLNKLIKQFENEIKKYIPLFNTYFKYNNYFESYKCKNIDNNNDSRDLNININTTQTIMSVWCGKISFIFELDSHINKFILS